MVTPEIYTIGHTPSLHACLPSCTMVAGAEGRWRNSVAAFEDAMKVQAGVVGNLGGARSAIDQLVTASQSATGALQAAQAGNQLLALQSQQDRKSTRLNSSH